MILQWFVQHSVGVIWITVIDIRETANSWKHASTGRFILQLHALLQLTFVS